MTVKPHFYYPMLAMNKLQQVGSNGGDRTGKKDASGIWEGRNSSFLFETFNNIHGSLYQWEKPFLSYFLYLSK